MVTLSMLYIKRLISVGHSIAANMGESVVRTLISLAGALVLAQNGVNGDTNPRSTCDPTASNQTVYDFSIGNVFKNDTIHLSQFRGKVTLIVNVATY